MSRGLSDSNRIDPVRLRTAVADDLLRETLLEWLEANSTVTEKAPEPAEADQASDEETASSAKPAKGKKEEKKEKKAGKEGGKG